jgi:hypothetical protein
MRSAERINRFRNVPKWLLEDMQSFTEFNPFSSARERPVHEHFPPSVGVLPKGTGHSKDCSATKPAEILFMRNFPPLLYRLLL